MNTLLDFSRIEAGRIDAHYEPTDLTSFTAELASVFRSAVEKAGLQFIVDCDPLPQPVYVDREMWEKILLNLLSNAFKFTFDGQIRVELRSRGDRVELRVADTGVGIPEADLPRMFERFHRVKHVRARTHEGTGIGLALVQELARLHGGGVTVESEEGRGTTFTVSVRIGNLAPSARNESRGPGNWPRPAARSRTLRKCCAGCPRPISRPPRRRGLPRDLQPVRPSVGDCATGADRGRQRRHARISPPHSRSQLSCRCRRRRPGCVGPDSRARSGSRAVRRDDARARWVRPPLRDPRRRTNSLDPGHSAVGARGRGGANRGPGCRR